MALDCEGAVKQIDDVLATPVSSGREGVAQQVAMFGACIDRLAPADSPYRTVIQHARNSPREKGTSYPAMLLQGALKGLREDFRTGRAIPSQQGPSQAQPPIPRLPRVVLLDPPEELIEDLRPPATISVAREYRALVEHTYPEHVHNWPLVGGSSAREGTYQGQQVVIFVDAPGSWTVAGIGEIDRNVIGLDLDVSSRQAVRQRFVEAFGVPPRGGVVLLAPDGSTQTEELRQLMARHEIAVGLVKMKIFLSHKGSDKPRVRKYKRVLEQLGFDPWLDEDALVAGDELNRAILKGMKDSCAAIFFVTESFKDDTWLGDEVDYAKQRKLEDPQGFAIVTLVIGDHEKNVPELLSKYVYKKPETDLDALREILRALPLEVGPVRRKH